MSLLGVNLSADIRLMSELRLSAHIHLVLRAIMTSRVKLLFEVREIVCPTLSATGIPGFKQYEFYVPTILLELMGKVPNCLVLRNS